MTTYEEKTYKCEVCRKFTKHKMKPTHNLGSRCKELYLKCSECGAINGIEEIPKQKI